MQTYFHVFIKECRLNAGFSKIKSARLLNVSERSLSDYESGKTAVDDALAVKMAQIIIALLSSIVGLKIMLVAGCGYRN